MFYLQQHTLHHTFERVQNGGDSWQAREYPIRYSYYGTVLMLRDFQHDYKPKETINETAALVYNIEISIAQKT